MEYIDLYLVHWPVNGRMIDAWETMKCLRDEGKCRSIGVSNFSIRRFEDDLWPHVDAAISARPAPEHAGTSTGDGSRRVAVHGCAPPKK